MGEGYRRGVFDIATERLHGQFLLVVACNVHRRLDEAILSPAAL